MARPRRLTIITERGMNMKTTHLIAALVGLVAMGILAVDASAMYNPSTGTFMQRDPGAGSAARIGAGGPLVGGGFIPMDQYADGMNLYQYCRSSPVVHRDPSGLTVVIPTFDDGPVAAEYRNPAPGNCPQSQAAALSDLVALLGALGNVKAVFYVTYVNKCCPGVDMKKAFQDGVHKINDAGHIVGLHAYNHDAYKGIFQGNLGGLGPDKAKDDINTLISLIRKAGIEPTMVWRTPYGNHQLDQAIVAGNTIATHTWDIDSKDWYYHWDNSLPGANSYRGDSDAAKQKWQDNVVDQLKSGVFWSGGDGDPWTDILFHVNRKTPAAIGTFMDTVKDEYQRWYTARWSDTTPLFTDKHRRDKFYWLRDLNDPDFKEYLKP